jgi:hypothetical protein
MSLLKSESVILLVDSLYAEATETVKSRVALLASSSELIWILGDINFRGQALKPLPICEFVSRVRKVPSSNTIQQVENDWWVI